MSDILFGCRVILSTRKDAELYFDAADVPTETTVHVVHPFPPYIYLTLSFSICHSVSVIVWYSPVVPPPDVGSRISWPFCVLKPCWSIVLIPGECQEAHRFRQKHRGTTTPGRGPLGEAAITASDGSTFCCS